MDSGFINIFQDFISPICFFQAILMGCYLLNIKNGQRFQNRLLAFYFLTFGVVLGAYLANRSQLLTEWITVFRVLSDFRMILAPLFYLYLRSTFKPLAKIRWYHVFHFLLFFFVLIDRNVSQHLVQYSWRIYISLDLFQFGAYSLWSLFEFKLWQFSNTQLSKQQQTWIKYFILINLVMWSLRLVDFLSVMNVVTLPETTYWFVLFFWLSNLIFFNSVVYLALKFPGLFLIRKKYSRSALPEHLIQLYHEKLKTLMDENKPYLNPDLSLDSLAKQLNISSKHLSQVINHSGQHFYDLINQYRIQEAKNLLKNKNGENILQIAYEAGFNSKPTFNAAFKKTTGMTPSEYIQHQKSTTSS